MTDDPLPSQFYKNASPDEADAFQLFRQNYPLQSLTIHDTNWTYIATGEKTQPTILWLVGGIRCADAAFRSIPILESNFHIIAPDYPALMSMSELVDGLAKILLHENISKAHILAGSFGGMIAQVMIHRHPEMIDKIILSTTTSPDIKQQEHYQEQLHMIQNIPEELVMEGAKIRFLDLLGHTENTVDFWKAYLDELFTIRLNKSHMLSTFNCILDFMSDEHFVPTQASRLSNRMMILSSDNDAVFGDEQQNGLYERYPNAKSHIFTGAGHSPASADRNLYFRIVHKFLQA